MVVGLLYVNWNDFDAALFDLDGVLTPTAEVHMRAWQALFTDFLTKRGFVDQPYVENDYFAHIDGKPRYDGVRSFLASRGITLAEGDLSDGPGDRDGLRAGQPEERLLRRRAPRRGGAAVPGLGPAARPPGRPGHQGRGRLLLPQRAAGAGRGRPGGAVRGGGRRQCRRPGALPGKPAPDTFATQPPARRAAGPGRRLRGRAVRVSRLAGPAGSGWGSAPTGVGAERLLESGPTWWSPTSQNWPSDAGSSAGRSDPGQRPDGPRCGSPSTSGR